AAVKTLARALDARDMPARGSDSGGQHYQRNSVAAQRRLAFFENVRAALTKWIAEGDFPKRQRAAALRAIRELEDEAFIGVTAYDDHDIGTYHSYGKDEPFVHYLELLLGSLPVDGSEAMATLGADAQVSVRRQRKQLEAHLDALMRSKYAFAGTIAETDIENTVGGMLIDRETRMPVSVVPGGDAFSPEYELLRIDPAAAEHAHAGAWVYRDAKGKLHLPEGLRVDVDDGHVLSARKRADQLTFMRAPGDPRLRDGIAFDWDGDGIVQGDRIEWVSWAGHCDVKGVTEALGLVLDDAPKLHEFRSDTLETQVYDRALLLEMVASIIELGSDYRSLDGTDEGQQGESAFGGARNDSRPDRLGFATASRRTASWPADGDADSFRVTSIVLADGTRAELDQVFLRWSVVADELEFAANPSFVRTVDDDMGEIDVTGAKLGAAIEYYDFDRRSGALIRKASTVKLDLGARSGREVLLGTVVEDAEERRLQRVFYQPDGPELVFRGEQLVEGAGGWKVKRTGDDRRVALAASRKCTLAREQRRDDPQLYRALLDDALRRGRPICADTDAEAAVWNGLVTKLDVRKLGDNAEARVQHWRVEVTARFGKAALEYLLRRDAEGEPLEACPLPGKPGEQWPDFLWSELPDIASKALVARRWMVNTTMYDRGIVTVEPDRSVEGGFYVHDDHVKHVLELIYCALSEHRWTIVHDGKRYGFTSASKWKAAVAKLEKRRAALSFAD
ncbi:MAG: hypothetical protein IAG13_30275, partial [Deltaproteobacteria bacterium]|nr:hypothetical protein [Nannocystaceae bacterium]